MSVLIVGGTGTIASRVVKHLQDANVPFVVTSRRGQDGALPGTKTVKFDWHDSSTFQNPFQIASYRAAYLVAPYGDNPAIQMNPFIDLAIEKGVKRFVLVGDATVTKGGRLIGPVWERLADKSVELSVLRPNWFLDNLLAPPQITTIRDEGKIYSSVGDGRAPHLSTDDIAAVAYKALTNPTPVGENLTLLGAELLNYDQLAEKMSAHIGRPITHIKLTQEGARKHLEKFGWSGWVVDEILHLEQITANGEFHSVDTSTGNDTVRLLGRPALSADEWLEKNKAAFM